MELSRLQKGVRMLRPTVIKAIPKDDYKLLLEFDNGEKKSFDVTPYIKGSWFGKLHDKPYFSSDKTWTNHVWIVPVFERVGDFLFFFFKILLP